ncbi:hypothetical protein [Paenibacillus sp. GCM10027626]|uniref:hypothetical protein n=1 Tax=Paenibacillus sp. GCM10027626 TaxID=3273411 RepID=UPI0036425C47
MEEVKAMLRAIIENQAITNAKLDALEMKAAKFEGEVRSNFRELQSQMDYLAGKLGQHDKDLYILRHNLQADTEKSY